MQFLSILFGVLLVLSMERGAIAQSQLPTDTAFAEVVALYDAVTPDTTVCMVLFVPRDSYPTVRTVIQGNQLVETIEVHGRFDLIESLTERPCTFSPTSVSSLVRINRRWQGDASYLQLRPLLKGSAAKDPFFLTTGASTEILNRRFFGPFPRKEANSTGEMVRLLISFKSGSASVSDIREELIRNQSRPMALLGLAILRARGELTIADFLLDGSPLISHDDVTIISDLMYQAATVDDARRTLSAELQGVLARCDNRTKLAVVRALTDLARSNTFNARSSLAAQGNAFREWLSRSANEVAASEPEIADAYQSLASAVSDQPPEGPSVDDGKPIK